MSHAIGLDIGGTSLKSVVVDRNGVVKERSTTKLNISKPDWPETVRQRFLTMEGFCDLIDPGDRLAVGLAAPGIARPDGRSIWWMQGRLSELENLDWSAFFGRDTPVLNDAQAALLGEAWLGAAAGQKNVVLLTLGTGVGGAAMVDGHLLKGAVGRAGHLGHISLNPDGPLDITNCPGSLEYAVGNCSIAERTGGDFQSTLELAAAAARTEPVAMNHWSLSIRALAAAISSIVNVLDPETVVIGGGIAAAGDALFVPLAEEMERMEWRPHGHRVKIAPATLGEYAGAIGAARNAMECSGPRLDGPVD